MPRRQTDNSSGPGDGGAERARSTPSTGPNPACYTHLSDMHGSFHTRVLSATSSEAPYVLDGLRQYRLQLIPGLRREPRWNS